MDTSSVGDYGRLLIQIHFYLEGLVSHTPILSTLLTKAFFVRAHPPFVSLKLSTTLKEGRRTLPVALDINRIKPAIPASAKPPRLCCFCTLVRVGVSVVWLQTYLTKERYKRHLGHLGHHETTFLSLVSHPSGFSVLHTFVSSMES